MVTEQDLVISRSLLILIGSFVIFSLIGAIKSDYSGNVVQQKFVSMKTKS